MLKVQHSTINRWSGKTTHHAFNRYDGPLKLHNILTYYSRIWNCIFQLILILLQLDNKDLWNWPTAPSCSCLATPQVSKLFKWCLIEQICPSSEVFWQSENMHKIDILANFKLKSATFQIYFIIVLPTFWCLSVTLSKWSFFKWSFYIINDYKLSPIGELIRVVRWKTISYLWSPI